MEPATPHLILTGDFRHREFREIVDWLKRTTHVSVAPSVHELAAAAAEQPSGRQVILFAQSRPGQIAARDFDHVYQAFPLAHHVRLLGSHCEGERPVGEAPTSGIRVYWHQFLPRYRADLLAGRIPTSWTLPRTASELERTSCELIDAGITQMPLSPTVTTDKQPGLIVIFTPSGMMFDGLAATCRCAGYSVGWCPEGRNCCFRGAVAAIWDGHSAGHVEFEQLQQIAEALPEVPLIALLAFPRFDQVQTAHSCGARAVVTSPFMLPDLWHIIRQVSVHPTD